MLMSFISITHTANPQASTKTELPFRDDAYKSGKLHCPSEDCGTEDGLRELAIQFYATNYKMRRRQFRNSFLEEWVTGVDRLYQEYHRKIAFLLYMLRLLNSSTAAVAIFTDTGASRLSRNSSTTCGD